MKILLIDNFDSFTYNLVDEFEKRKCEVMVYRNNVDFKVIDNVVKMFKPNLIIISPGPGTPRDSGNSMQVIENYHKKIPIFGVCLGHQCIIDYFGGRVDRAFETIHGKSSSIKHDSKTIFKNLQNPLQVGRYHSLAGLEIPYCLEISARSESDVVMAVRHKDFFVEGVQFHPESILTSAGGKIIENLINLIKKQKNRL